MLHACVERFDVMGERENILGWDGEVNKALAIFFTKMPSASQTLVFRRSVYTTAVRIIRMLLLPQEQAEQMALVKDSGAAQSIKRSN
jgi:hypothetical protein